MLCCVVLQHAVICCAALCCAVSACEVNLMKPMCDSGSELRPVFPDPGESRLSVWLLGGEVSVHQSVGAGRSWFDLLWVCGHRCVYLC